MREKVFFPVFTISIGKRTRYFFRGNFLHSECCDKFLKIFSKTINRVDIKVMIPLSSLTIFILKASRNRIESRQISSTSSGYPSYTTPLKNNLCFFVVEGVHLPNLPDEGKYSLYMTVVLAIFLLVEKDLFIEFYYVMFCNFSGCSSFFNVTVDNPQSKTNIENFSSVRGGNFGKFFIYGSSKSDITSRSHIFRICSPSGVVTYVGTC